MELSEEHHGKLKSLTLVEKLNLIHMVEGGRAVKDVAEENGVNRNTLHYILKNREKIRETVNSKPGIAGFKRIKQTKSPELEKQILEFMYESRKRREKISGSIIKTVALTIASQLEVENFSASNGWLFAFFKRNNITLSEFNRGLDGKVHHDLVETKLISIAQDYQNEEEVITEVLIEREDQMLEKTEYIDDHECEGHEVKDEQEKLSTSDHISYDFIEEDVKEEYEMEIIEEEILWRNWCRLCGNCNTLPEIKAEHVKIVYQLLFIPPDQVKLCADCNLSLDDISKMVTKGKLVESMFVELQALETSECLTVDDLLDVRRDFGIDPEEAEIEAEEQDQETVEEPMFEDVIYEDIEELCEDFNAETEETTMTETVEEEVTTPMFLPDETSFVYKCHICDQDFDRMFLLTNHTKDRHNCMPKVKCSCGRFLSTWETMMAHKRKHSSDEHDHEFECAICNANFRTRVGLSIHIKLKHGRPKVNRTCTTCNKEFKDSTVLKAHIRTHLPDDEKFTFECEICGKRMVNKWSLKYHINTIHERQVTNFCHICGRGFGNKSNLRSHLISHSTENVSCGVCGGVFKNRVSLQSHRKVHKPAHLRTFSCNLCSKTFHSRNHLNRHQISHSSDRSFKCDYDNCVNEYKWQKDLRNHISSVHTGKLTKFFVMLKTFNNSF